MKDLKSLIILFKAQTSVENVVKKSLSGTGLSVNEFAALEALYHKQSLTTQELIDLVLIPNSSMTYVLDVLMKKNYIERNRNTEDKRIQTITLSPDGIEKFETVYKTHFQMMREIFDILDESEVTDLTSRSALVAKYEERYQEFRRIYPTVKELF